MKYLGRYLKRPPVSASRLRHYVGGAVVHHYLDRRTGKHKRQTLSQEEMIGRYISHVPARHFKMVRCSGFLANRKRGTLLPRIYEALHMQAREKLEKPGFAVLKKGFLGTDPYKCILCGDRLRFAGAQEVPMQRNCCQKGCVEWRKSDGCECLDWISAPEKWLSG